MIPMLTVVPCIDRDIKLQSRIASKLCGEIFKVFAVDDKVAHLYLE